MKESKELLAEEHVSQQADDQTENQLDTARAVLDCEREALAQAEANLVPTENYPPLVSFLSQCLPARYFAHALRAIILKGTDLSAVAQDLIFLSCFFLVTL